MKNLILSFLLLILVAEAHGQSAVRYTREKNGRKSFVLTPTNDIRVFQIKLGLDAGNSNIPGFSENSESIEMTSPVVFFGCSLQISAKASPLQLNLNFQGPTCRKVFEKMQQASGLQFHFAKANFDLLVSESPLTNCGDLKECARLNPGMAHKALSRGAWNLVASAGKKRSWLDPQGLIWSTPQIQQLNFDEAQFWCQKQFGWKFRLPTISEVPEVDETVTMLPLLGAFGQNWTSSVSSKEAKMAYTFAQNSIGSVLMSGHNDVLCIEEYQP